MLNNVSKTINSRISSENEASDFLMVINESEDTIALVDRDAFGKQINENGDERMRGLFSEKTEIDPDLTTGLQDETEGDDDYSHDYMADLTVDTDLDDEVEYQDDFSADYTADTEPDNLLDKEDMYCDKTTEPVDLDAYIEENMSIEELLKEGFEDDCTLPTDDADFGMEGEEIEGDSWFDNDDILMDIDEDLDLSEDFFMEGEDLDDGDMDDLSEEGDIIEDEFELSETEDFDADEMDELSEGEDFDSDEDGLFSEEDDLDMDEDFE